MDIVYLTSEDEVRSMEAHRRPESKPCAALPDRKACTEHDCTARLLHDRLHMEAAHQQAYAIAQLGCYGNRVRHLGERCNAAKGRCRV